MTLKANGEAGVIFGSRGLNEAEDQSTKKGPGTPPPQRRARWPTPQPSVLGRTVLASTEGTTSIAGGRAELLVDADRWTFRLNWMRERASPPDWRCAAIFAFPPPHPPPPPALGIQVRVRVRCSPAPAAMGGGGGGGGGELLTDPMISLGASTTGISAIMHVVK